MLSKMLSIALLGLIYLVTSSVADHTITMINNCNHAIVPYVKNTANGVTFKGNSGGKGTRWTTTVPERWSSGRIFGQPPGKCPAPDGPGCTLVECDFSNPNFEQCNLSTVSGYSDPTKFQWPCGSYTCTGGANCPAAYQPDGTCNGCIHQCNNANEPITVTWCP